MLWIVPALLFVGASASLICTITALATPNWAANNSTGFSTGLNYYCVNWTESCYAYGKDDKVGTFAAGLFFFWFGMLAFFFAAVVTATLTYFNAKQGDSADWRYQCRAAAIVFGASGIPSLISMTIFACLYASPPYEHGYSYYLGWTGPCINEMICLVLAAAVILPGLAGYIDRSKPSNANTSSVGIQKPAGYTKQELFDSL